MSSRKEQKEQARQERMAAEQQAAADASRGRRMKIIGVVGGGAAIVVIAAVAISLGGGNGSGGGGTVKSASAVESRFKGIPQSGITVGNPKAPVTLVEYADLKCPICKEFALGAFPTIVSNYVKTGKVKMEFRNQSFVGEQSAPGDSRRAATFAAAAGLQNKLWNVADLYYINQKDELTAYATDAWLRNIGSAIPGLDVNKAMASRKDPRVASQLAQAEQLFASNGFTGTPSFQVGKSGGKLTELTYTTIGSPDEFTSAIDAALK